MLLKVPYLSGEGFALLGYRRRCRGRSEQRAFAFALHRRLGDLVLPGLLLVYLLRYDYQARLPWYVRPRPSDGAAMAPFRFAMERAHALAGTAASSHPRC